MGMTRLARFLICFMALTVLVSGTVRNAYALEKNMTAPAIYNALTQTPEWLNTSRALKPDDLKGRIILIDFWTYCCINCIHVIPKLQELEKEFGDKLTVIGIHSAKFTTEGDTKNIREAVQKYGIEHPVVNDADFRIWNSFGANAWPTIALIGPDGLLKNVYKGEGDIEEMRDDIEKLIDKNEGRLVTAALPIALEKEKVPATILRFPTKLKEKDSNTLVISDSGNQRILLVDLKNHRIKTTIGSGKKGFQDGDFSEAQFSDPQGIVIDSDRIYVADTGNHRVRLVDLKKKQVTTIAGNGKRGGYMLIGSHKATSTSLASPWDLAFYPDANSLIIANAGTHQLWSYNLKDKTVKIIAGNGQESIEDGHLPFNSLSQPSGMSVQDGMLYFVDAETSSLRSYDGVKVKTLLGTGLFDFGLKDGKMGMALMQHPMGLYADQYNKIYVADAYNHKIRLYENDELTTLPLTGLNEPNGITKIGNIFYVADTNNHRIVEMDEQGNKIGVLDIFPMEKSVTYQKDLPNKLEVKTATIVSKAGIHFDLPKGWHINPDAPSYLALFDDEKKNIQTYKANELRNPKLALPELPPAGYNLQGVIYYCKEKAGSQCLIRSIDMQLYVSPNANNKMTITLPE